MRAFALWSVGVWPGIFFFNDTATTEIYTLSLHDALPISTYVRHLITSLGTCFNRGISMTDRKSTRLNSSHLVISYAVFCLKKVNSHVIPQFACIFSLPTLQKPANTTRG